MTRALPLDLAGAPHHFTSRPNELLFFFLNDPAPPEIHPFPPHAPLPIRARVARPLGRLGGPFPPGGPPGPAHHPPPARPGAQPDRPRPGGGRPPSLRRRPRRRRRTG